MLSTSPPPLPGFGSHVRDVVIQTYQTLVGREPTLAEQNHLLRIEANAGQNSLVPAIVATRAFYRSDRGQRCERLCDVGCGDARSNSPAGLRSII